MTLKSKTIALVTSAHAPDIAKDDRLLAEMLSNQGVKCVATPWDDPTIDWAAFDTILVRSCWNYHLNSAAFRNWVIDMENKSLPLANPPELILWNMNKYYMDHLSRKGVAIPQTEWLRENDFYPDKLFDLMNKHDWRKAVLKPCISASSFRTIVVTLDTALSEGKVLGKDFPEGGMMLQAFMEAVPQEGELSLMFFNGIFSHAVVKTSLPGEFRVQSEFGGRHRRIDVRETIVSDAKQILSLLPVMPLYARVDGIDMGENFCLMELELIEPVLFFDVNPGAADYLTTEIIKRITAKAQNKVKSETS